MNRIVLKRLSQLCFVFVFLICFVIQFHQAQAKTDPELCKTILERYRTILLEQPVLSADEIRAIQRQQSADGTWPDLDYKDKHPSGWKPKEHLDRMRSMTRALVNADHALYNNVELQKSVDRALDNWIEHRYKCTNWWWNDIGTRQHLRDVIILLDVRLARERRKLAIETMGNRKITGTGANLLWIAELSLHRRCLLDEEDQLDEPIEKIWAEIQTDAKEGIQPDWSFYQHGARAQTFGYGRSFFDMAVNTAWQLRGTKYEIPTEKREMISNYLLEGMQWMSRGQYTPAGTMDRAISRKTAKDAAVLVPLIERWLQVDKEHHVEIAKFLTHQKGAAKRPFGFRYFPYAEFAVFHRPAGSIFLKIISTRTKPTEPIIGENQLGVPYLHYGDHYVVQDGKEFTDLQPVFEWNHLPGLTVPEAKSNQERQEFAGGLGNGSSGMATMDYVRHVDGKKAVALHKTWFFHDDMMICLMCERDDDKKMNKASDVSITTSIEQCRLQGTVVADENATTKLVPLGETRLETSRWILHHKVGYFALDDSPMTVFSGAASGSWSSINTRYNDAPNSVTDKVLRIQIPHINGKTPAGFAILLDADAKKLASLQANPLWKVLKNDHTCQALKFKDGTVMVAFYEAGAINLNSETAGDASFRVDQPSLVMSNQKEAWLCDPTGEGKKVTFEWNGKKQKVMLPEKGMGASLTKSN